MFARKGSRIYTPLSRISNSATILRNTRSARSSKSVRAVSPRAVRAPVCVYWRQSPRQPCDVVSVPADATCAAGRVVKQDEGGSRTVSYPTRGEWACIGAPRQLVPLLLQPLRRFPHQVNRDDSVTVRSHTDGRAAARRRGRRCEGPFSCRLESPLLCRVVRADCPP